MGILAILVIVLVFYYGQGNIYSKNCFKKVSADIKFSLNGVFEGEEVELIETCINKKIIPLWWVTAKFQVSRNLIFIEEKNQNKGNDNYRRDFHTVMPFEKVSKTFKIISGKRGYYSVDALELHSGDLFGLNKIIATYEAKTHLYVYPKLIVPQELKIKFKSLSGEVITKRNIIEDPFQIRGIRDYYSFDSMKAVNWSATAKTGELKVNEYDFTASQEVIIFLNVERYNAWDAEFVVEEAISLAASLITQYLQQGMKVGLKVNGYNSTSGLQISLPAVGGTNQNLHFYENLACLDITEASGPLATMLEEEQMKHNKTALWVVVSHYFGAELREQVTLARNSGYDLKWIIPKNESTVVELEDNRDSFVWEVGER
ncbi:MAG: DUF58 domain-containing protein [Clostridiaceae bacterium]|nr:DUF58 domain-containing protein [Clostridiaceae bacterium]